MTTQPHTQERTKMAFSVIGLILPTILAVIVGYGTVKFTSGAEQEKIVQMQAEIAELRRMAEQNRDRLVTQEVLKVYVDSLKDSIEQVRVDIRNLRNK